MKIFKYEIPLKYCFSILMPVHSKVVSFEVQNNIPMIWALVNEFSTEVMRHFSIIATGEKINFDVEFNPYIGSIQLDGFVWHLFERAYTEATIC